ncbi:VOC family protein [Emcibacteraceae bacterium]|nr:VOC family protein [Emcibacteraceae bacterium]
MASVKPTYKTNFQPATYLVSDIERSLKLYRDILGFKIDFYKDYGEGSYAYEIFNIKPSIPLNFCALSTDDELRCFALLELKDTKLETNSGLRRAAKIVRCEHFDIAVEKLKDIGLTMFDEHQLKTKDGRIGRELGFLDFDDNLVVIYCITSVPD